MMKKMKKILELYFYWIKLKMKKGKKLIMKTKKKIKYKKRKMETKVNKLYHLKIIKKLKTY